MYACVTRRGVGEGGRGQSRFAQLRQQFRAGGIGQVGVDEPQVERGGVRQPARGGGIGGDGDTGGQGGGGRPDFAQAGGPDGDKLDAALAAVKAVLAA